MKRFWFLFLLVGCCLAVDFSTLQAQIVIRPPVIRVRHPRHPRICRPPVRLIQPPIVRVIPPVIQIVPRQVFRPQPMLYAQPMGYYRRPPVIVRY